MEVPAVGVLVDRERLRAGRQGDVRGDRGPGLVAAGIRHRDRAAEVGARRVGDVQRVGDRVGRRHAEADRVAAGRGYLDGVLEPLSRVGPAHVVGTARDAGVLRVGGGLEVDAVGAVAVGGAVDGRDVVGSALAAGVVVRRLHGAGHRRGRPAEGLVTAGPATAATAAAAARARGEGHEVEVPAVGVLVDGERLLAGRQGDAGGDGGPGLVAAGVRYGDRAGEAGAGGVGDVQRVGDPVRRRHAEGDGVGAGRRDVNGVLEPLAWCGPAHVVAAAGHAGVLGVGGGLEVDAVGAVAVGAAVGRGDVVGGPLAAGVVVRRLERAGHGRGRPAERGFRGRGGRVRHGRQRGQHGKDGDGQGQRPSSAATRPGRPGPGQVRNVY